MAFNFFKKQKEPESEEISHQRYYNLTVKEVINETSDAITIVFEQPDKKISYKAGQFLTLIIPINGKKVRRAYSLCTSPYTEDDLAVTVKRVENGLMSNYLNDNLKPGDTIEIMEPMGSFTTEFNKENKRHIVMFGGGSGITPMMSIIKATLSEEPKSIVTLIYCNRNIDSVIFKDELEKIQNDSEGRLRVIHVLDEAPMDWQGPSGLLNHEMLTELFERIPDWGLENTVYLMCGPEGMMNNAQTLLEKQGIPKEKIFKESFVQGTINKELKKSDEEKVDEEEISTQEVTIIHEGEEHKITVEPDNTILETALDLDIDLPYSCQSGLCTACRCKLLQGKIKMDEDEGLSDSEKDQGYVLICVGHPLTPDVKLEVG